MPKKKGLRLTSNKILNSFRQWHISQTLLQLLRDQGSQNVDSSHRSVLYGGSRASTGRGSGGGDGSRSRGSSSTARGSGGFGSGFWLFFHGVDIIVDLLGVLVVAEDLTLYGGGGVVCLVLRG